MSWRPAYAASTQSLKALLEEEEWRQVALTSRMTGRDTGPRWGRLGDGHLWIHEVEGRTRGAFYLSRWGVGLPAFEIEELNPEDVLFLTTLLKSRRSRLFSLIGQSSRVIACEKLLAESPMDAEDYRMLIRDRTDISDPSVVGGLEFSIAGPRDLDRLFPLERSYQIEEVLRHPKDADDAFMRRQLSTTIDKQLVVFATLAGRPVAKANTNARGWCYDQIGGVFVIPDLRDSGIGKAVMTKLLQAIYRVNRRPCLFVKTSNTAANALYASLGFEDRGPFRISYWQH